MIKKQKQLIIIFSIVVVLMLAGYFVADKYIFSVEDTEETTKSVETQAGEQLGTSDRYMMYPQIERADMKSIKVTNEHGTYEFYKDENDQIQIRGFEGTAWNAELFSQLMVDTGYTLSITKVVTDVTEQQLADYGLDPASDPATFTITDKNDVSYTVYVGEETLTQGGYYCMLEGRNSVYMLGTTLGSTVLAPIENFVTPLITTGISTSSYFFIDDFTILHGEDLFFRTYIVDPEDQFNPDALCEHKVLYPAPYNPSDTTYYEALSKVAALTGDYTVKLGVTEEDLAKYGLENPAYTIYFTYENPEDTSAGKLEYLLLISEMQEDGGYYVLSPLQDIIAHVTSESLGFLQWDIIKWIDKPIFQVNINRVEEIKIEAPSVTDTYHLSGVDKELVVVSDMAGQFEDVYNFRQFYKTLLTVQIEDYAPLTEDEIEELKADPSRLLLTFSYKMRSGDEVVYRFYWYSTRRALVTINDSGEFYVLRDMVEKIENDTHRVINGEKIDSSAKN